jgi:hypothetical protein
MCCQALVMAVAQGQVTGIFSWRRPPRTSRAAVCRIRYLIAFGSIGELRDPLTRPLWTPSCRPAT